MKLINLTDHPVNVLDADGVERVIQPSGITARLEEAREETQPIYTTSGVFKTNVVVRGRVVDLPEPQPGVAFIVSSFVLQAVDGSRADVFAPGPLIRENGKVVACKGLTATSHYAIPF
jgi:hypothetical protein